MPATVLGSRVAGGELGSGCGVTSAGRDGQPLEHPLLSCRTTLELQFIISGCLSIGAEKSPTECAVKGSQTMNVISAIFALLGIVAFIVDLNLNGLYRSNFNYYSYLVLLAGNGISIVLLIFTILEFCIAVATANFWCRATRLSSNEAMLIVPSATRVDLAVPPAELPQPPSYTELTAPEV
ncbi:membrane-spanning 4-domains subfamily A member 12-like [Cyanistes caeruleus]|uniref:membrane-spanning 4-domains subfamily A member 12-like n=1 Tax=Cyanistes caeruleus TaxID=156563 RepID=UPI000CDA42B1|nr:membrane-spanning 4-domains subfamily A member 12-like [Cyanistes caeruleus]